MAAKAAPKRNPSAEKRARQSEKRNERNRIIRSRIRTAVKAVNTAVEEKNPEASASALSSAIRIIGSAGTKGIIHKNTAARKISRLTKSVNALSKAGAV